MRHWLAPIYVPTRAELLEKIQLHAYCLREDNARRRREGLPRMRETCESATMLRLLAGDYRRGDYRCGAAWQCYTRDGASVGPCVECGTDVAL